MFTSSWDRGILFFTIFVENRVPLISIGRCHAKGRGRRVRMSSSGDMRELGKSRARLDMVGYREEDWRSQHAHESLNPEDECNEDGGIHTDHRGGVRQIGRASCRE